MAFRLLALAPFPEDGTSVYRAWGPLCELRRIIPDLEIHSVHTLSSNPSGSRLAWPEFNNVDAVMLQRPFAPDHVAMAHMAKVYKKPLWIDYDDDLFAVPACNPTHTNYETPQVKQNIEAIAKMADIITVSTKALGKRLSQFNQKVMVVPNALNLRLLHRQDGALPRSKCVVWRGSHCHLSDLMGFSTEILEAYTEFPDWSWVFVGYNPTWITSKMDLQKRTRCLPFDGDYMNFMGNMQRLRAAIQIVPLVPIDFNFAKSRIAHLEGSLAGSAVLVPEWEEWEQGKLYRYSGAFDFREKLFHMMSSPLDELAEANNQDWNWVETHRSLSVVNEFRKGIIQAFRQKI